MEFLAYINSNWHLRCGNRHFRVRREVASVISGHGRWDEVRRQG
jgi:hypothetical protein